MLRCYSGVNNKDFMVQKQKHMKATFGTLTTSQQHSSGWRWKKRDTHVDSPLTSRVTHRTVLAGCLCWMSVCAGCLCWVSVPGVCAGCLTYELGASPDEGQKLEVIESPNALTASRLHPVGLLQLPHHSEISRAAAINQSVSQSVI